VQGDRPDGADLVATEFLHQLAHERSDRGGTVTGVVPQSHRRRTGVVRLAGDQHLGPRNALQVLDGADGDALEVEHRALLDVKLNVRVRPIQWHRRIAKVADTLQFVLEHLAVDAARGVQLLQRDPADVGERSRHVRVEARTLLVGESADDNRPTRCEPGIVQCLDDLETAEHAKVAVVATAGAHGVDVRTRHDRGAGLDALLAAAQPEDVSDRVDAHFEPELVHPANHQVAAGLVLVGQREPAAAAVRGRADCGKGIQALHQPLGIDTQLFSFH
jgi:hypothetical protein